MYIYRQARRLALAGASMLLLCAAVGCGARGTGVPVGDPEASRRALASALDAWKSGASGADGTVTVEGQTWRVADEDWLAGARLIDYQMDASGDSAGALTRPGTDSVSARLTIIPARGRKLTRAVVYQITPGSSPMIVRQD